MTNGHIFMTNGQFRMTNGHICKIRNDYYYRIYRNMMFSIGKLFV